MPALSRNLVETPVNNSQPTAPANYDYDLPAVCDFVGVSLYFPGAAPGAITLNIQGSVNGTNFVTMATLNSVAANSQAVVDMRSFRKVRLNLATFTAPQNIIISIVARK